MNVWLIILIAFPLVLILSTLIFLRWLKLRNLGSLKITTESVAYDEVSYGHILKWDKYCFYLHGKPLLVWNYNITISYCPVNFTIGDCQIEVDGVRFAYLVYL
jgi:hypothetical protein